MTILLFASAAYLLGHLVTSRSRRAWRHQVAREQRRGERERQWRAMILDAQRDDRAH